MPEYTLKERSVTLNEDFDVIVAGGGPAGCAAAAAASRGGAKTLLLERCGALGGMGTLGLVPWFCGYYDGKNVLARGIAEYVRLGLCDGMPLLKKQMSGNPLCEPAIDPELLKRIYDNLMTETGVTVQFYSQLCDLEMASGDKVDVLLVASKSGLTAFRAKVYVDCTGDGDLAFMAGASFEKGDGKGQLQPATHCFVITNVDEYAMNAGPSIHFFDPESPVHKAIKSGRYPLIEDLHSCFTQIGPRTYGFNTGHLYDVDNTNPESVSRALMRGRGQVAQYLGAFKEFHPAFANSFLAATGTLLGVRETRRIKGDYILSVDDYLARRSFPDEICRNAYNIDIHESKEEVENIIKESLEVQKKNIAEKIRQLGTGESYGVPYRCLVPAALTNVLMAGRCISTDRLVNGSVRIMACCLTTGEAAGTAAALSALENADVRAVDTSKLRKLLRENGAYLP